MGKEGVWKRTKGIGYRVYLLILNSQLSILNLILLFNEQVDVSAVGVGASYYFCLG